MATKNKTSAASAEAESVPVYRGRSYTINKPTVTVVKKRRLLLKLIILLIIVGVALIPVLYYYYQRYSEIIDAGLQGRIFERSSGIYAAPLTLYTGAPVRQTDLIRYLQGVGYLQRGTSENETRGSYNQVGSTVEIIPGAEAVINGTKTFQPLRIVFGPNGYGIQSITDTDKRLDLPEAQLEPEQISATINQQREKRKIIEYKDLPPHLVNAIVVIEDRAFFDHSGISLRGIARAFFRNYEAGEVREGGSTITQQLVKSFFLTPERTPKRKLSEAYMAIILERKLTKEQILAMYCNQIYLGQRGGFSINGFGEAARAYFGKDINYLNLSESALLAGIIRSPNYYSPYSHEDRARDRRNFVLDQMAEAGKITPAEAENAKLQSLGLISKGGTDATDAPYFVDYVMRQLDIQYGEDSQSMRSMRIYTTVDLDLQHAAVAAVAKNMPEIDRLVMQRRGRINGLQVALAAVNAKTGEVLAMVGGRDYAMSQLNRATDAKRQPGSVFKPFVYAAALSEADPSRRITTAMTFLDEPRGFEYDGKYYAPGNFRDDYEMRAMTVREALVKSKNVITVTIAERLGFPQVSNFAQRAGLQSVPAVPAAALGASEATPLQMASAYTSFANQGKRAAPIAIKRLTTKDGTVVFESQPQITDVMSPQVAYIMTSMMEDVLNRGTGARVRQMGFRAPAAGKTGSSRDGWFAGYTPNLACAVWVGFDDNTDIGVTGGSTAALIWADFMNRALQLRPHLGGTFEPPTTGLVAQYVDPMGEPAQIDTPGARQELFLTGTQNGEAQDFVPPPTEQPPAIQPASVEMPNTASPTEPVTNIQTPPRPTPYPPPAGQNITSGGADSLIPVPPSARGKVTLSGEVPPRAVQTPIPTPSPSRSTIRAATERILSTVTGVKAPSTVAPTPTQSRGASPRSSSTAATVSTPRPATVRVPGGTTGKASPYPTPWPAPKQFASSQTIAKQQPAAKQNLKAGNTRPRIVPTPTPKPKTPERSAKTTAVKEPSKQLTKAAKSTPTPAPKPATTPTPKPAATSLPKKTFWLEVCSVSGLLPVKGLCTKVRRSYNIGEEPTTTCSAARHKDN